jgi:hypothetical protein
MYLNDNDRNQIIAAAEAYAGCNPQESSVTQILALLEVDRPKCPKCLLPLTHLRRMYPQGPMMEQPSRVPVIGDIWFCVHCKMTMQIRPEKPEEVSHDNKTSTHPDGGSNR